MSCPDCHGTKFREVAPRVVERCPCTRAAGAPMPLSSSADPEVKLLAKFLMAFAPGRRRAMTRADMESKHLDLVHSLGVRAGSSFERKLRSLASLANDQLVPICTGNDGYFYGVEPEDFDDSIGRISSQIQHETHRLARLRAMREHLESKRATG